MVRLEFSNMINGGGQALHCARDPSHSPPFGSSQADQLGACRGVKALGSPRLLRTLRLVGSCTGMEHGRLPRNPRIHA